MMKKTIALVLTIILFVSQIGVSVMADTPNLKAPSVSSLSAILMDAQTGEILYAKNAHTKRFPASTTKIMTCLLALEKALAEENGLNTVFTVDSKTVAIESGSSNAALRVGEELTIEQLLYFAMVVSGNDAANALGQYVCDGDLEAFSKLMTQRAAELGCQNTFFWNAHGLNEAPESQDKHITSAYDLALIMKQAVSIPKFVELISTTYYEAAPTNKTDKTRKYYNTNKMIFSSNADYYEYCVGGKTGWTTPAGHTLVTYAEKNGRKLICVVLKANGRPVSYADSKALFEYGFSENNFSVVSLDNILPTGELSQAVTVMKNGEIAGSVQVSADIAQTLYVPSNCNPQEIKCELVCPELIEDGEDINAHIKVTMPEGWNVNGFDFGNVLLDAIVGEVVYLPKPTETPTSGAQGKDDEIGKGEKEKGGTIVLKIFIAIFVVLLLLVIIRRCIVLKRRKKKKYWWKEQL